MKHILSLMLLCILFSAASCKKEQPDPPPDLPPLTHVGAMTFGCYVNGEPWVAQVPPFSPTEVPLIGSYSKNDSVLIISATRIINPPNREVIRMRISGDIENTEHHFVNEVDRCYSNYQYRCINNTANNNFNQLIDSFNYIRISYWNVENRIVSGTFDFTVYAVNCPEETVQIRNGRFDLIVSIID